MNRLVLVAAALVLGSTTQARADSESRAHVARDSESRAKLFPLSSSGLPKSLKGAPAELTRVVARSLGAETTTVPIEDAADLIECTLTQRTCLEAIAGSVGVSRIIYGRIEARGDGYMVKLTSFETGKGDSQRSIAISGTTPDELADSLRDALDGVAKTPIPIDPLPAAESSGGVTTGTWAMVIGGGITAGVGLGLLVSANSLRAEVQRAPRETLEDIDRLVQLETAGKARVKIGGALTAVGGVVATIGIIRMVVQKKSARPEQPRVDVIRESGGASVVFTMGWQ